MFSKENPPPKKNKQLKINSRDPKQARFWQLKKLPCFKEIYDLIIKGVSVHEVARCMHEDLKVFLHMKRISLENYIFEYRETLPTGVVLQTTSPQFLERTRQKARVQIDVLNEYSRLYEIQIKRIERTVEQENEIGISMNALEGSIKTAQGLLDSIHNVQSDLGITPKNLGTMGIDANIMQSVSHRLTDDNVTKVLDSPVSRHKVLNVAERILALAAESKQDGSMQKLARLLEDRIIDTVDNTNLVDYNNKDQIVTR